MSMKMMLMSIFVITCGFSIAQTADYFSRNQQWTCSYSSPGTWCNDYEDYTFFVSGIANFVGKEYYVIGKRFHHYELQANVYPCDNEFSFTQDPWAYVRQSGDSIYVYENNGSEKLLIDYNLGIGDTVGDGYFSGGPHVVYDIDTLLINGQKHRVFNLDNQGEVQIIEGIGHRYGSWEGFCLFMNHTLAHVGQDYNVLKCYEQNGATVWTSDSNIQNCNYMEDLSVHHSLFEKKIKVYPNPTMGIVNLDVNLDLTHLKMYNLHGFCITSINLDRNSNVLDITSFDKGLYSCQFWRGVELVGSLIILKL